MHARTTIREEIDTFLGQLNNFATTFSEQCLAALRFNGTEGFLGFYLKTFPLRGYDHINGTFNGEPIVEEDSKGKKEFIDSDAYEYLTQFKIMLAAFLGLPIVFDAEAQKTGQTWGNIGWQFVGWYSSLYSAPIKVLLAFFFILRNLVIVLCKLPINIAKLVTEFLPHYLLALSGIVFATIVLSALKLARRFTERKDPFAQPKNLPNMLWVVGCIIVPPVALAIAIVSGVIAAVSAVLYYVGRSVTSPGAAIAETWAYWNEHNPQHPRTSLAIRLFFTGLRILTTATVYALIAVFALPALAALVGPLAPVVLVPVTHALMGATAAMLQFFSVIVPAVSLIPTTPVLLALIGAAVGVALAVVGVIIGWVNRLYKPAKPAAASESAYSPLGNAEPTQHQSTPLTTPRVTSALLSAPAAPTVSAVLANPAVPPSPVRVGKVAFSIRREGFLEREILLGKPKNPDPNAWDTRELDSNQVVGSVFLDPFTGMIFDDPEAHLGLRGLICLPDVGVTSLSRLLRLAPADRLVQLSQVSPILAAAIPAILVSTEASSSQTKPTPTTINFSLDRTTKRLSLGEFNPAIHEIVSLRTQESRPVYTVEQDIYIETPPRDCTGQVTFRYITVAELVARLRNQALLSQEAVVADPSVSAALPVAPTPLLSPATVAPAAVLLPPPATSASDSVPAPAERVPPPMGAHFF